MTCDDGEASALPTAASSDAGGGPAPVVANVSGCSSTPLPRRPANKAATATTANNPAGAAKGRRVVGERSMPASARRKHLHSP
eukprot:CAMPEP_0171098872 /NCGR_PEP_ID=MMETSP0766_2-20121228/49738_1 /TAXON_ID=439317 /ORGANISM="Gambierdiscus australes, Strain CAWD 149" /LENGTH=82 /DNA_ID=CAMNT_0011558339 /DNA_START=388 /DNA_END=633 /DNA_ORIENTATION=-